MRTVFVYALVFASIILLGACADLHCPDGQTKIGTVCVPERHYEAGVPCDAAECAQGAIPGQNTGYVDSAVDAYCRGTPEGCADASDSACDAADCDARTTCDGSGSGGGGCGNRPSVEADARACGITDCTSSSQDISREGIHVACGEQSGTDAGATCTCEPEYGNCDGPTDPEHGCETHLASNAKHCSVCGYACDGDLACTAGVCEQKVNRLVLGAETSCALLEPSDAQGARALLCWGSNANNLLRAGPEVSRRPTASPIPEVARVRNIALGEKHACALDDQSDDILCWGDNTDLQLGTSRTDVTNAELIKAKAGNSLRQVMDLVAGYGHTCARVAGAVWCWGTIAAETGIVQMGDQPQRIAGIDDAAQLAAFYMQTCVRRGSGQVACLGDQYGTSPTGIKDETGALLTDIVEVAPGYAHVCVLRASGEVGCWGDNAQAQLARDATFTDQGYGKVPGLANVVQLVSGSSFTCALTSEHLVSCWGANHGGRLAVSSSSPQVSTPLPVVSLDDVVEIAAGYDHACARRRTGRVVCWGENRAGQLGDGTMITPTSPVEVVSLL